MVETRLTPGRSSDRSLDGSGSLQARTSLLAQTTRAWMSTHAHGSFDGGVSGTRANAIGGPIATRAMALPPRQPHSNRSIIQEERQWRRPDILASGNRLNLRLFAARWSGTDLREQTSEITGDYHMLSISLEPTEFSIWLGMTPIPNKKVIPGTIQLTPPAVPARIVYHQAYDVLHVFIQNVVLKEFYEWSYGKQPIGDVHLRDPNYAYDPLIGQLGVALLSADELGGSHGELYGDSISLAIVARLFALYAEKPDATSQKNVGALPTWRLKRVIDLMEAQADKPITLADLARTAGLSRMHFAAQFRKATNLRPHEYLLRRRIEKAKVMLTTGSSPIADVALTLGFSSQSHFTGVFKRFTGQTPRSWRDSNRR
jgi:AraC family transcriptional regulator